MEFTKSTSAFDLVNFIWGVVHVDLVYADTGTINHTFMFFLVKGRVHLILADFCLHPFFTHFLLSGFANFWLDPFFAQFLLSGFVDFW